MAFRSMSYLRSMMRGIRGSNSATYATSTTPKLKAYAPTADYGHFQEHQQRSKTKAIRGDFVPVYVAIGMIVLSTTLGLHTVMQQLRYSPGVRVKKKERETLPEVFLPDKVVDEADKFKKKSFFRKVAHVQEFEYGDHSISDPIRKDAFAHKPRAETLKSVGVDPTPH
ncbi:hypothetical protein Pint_01308 [Pistacia integerrima]|uniref:Uncharacterized protein n=1 Tax=Pistacia integerrima TaxID=434235 RepID=A0ACC0ZML3_9ROSI|nr:hypothetical protein Pint_01308 [Pistacia integerrima]